MVDRDDDVKLGIRTSALTFGRFDVAAVAACYAVYLAGMAWVGHALEFGANYWAGLAIAAVLAGYHLWIIRTRDRDRVLPRVPRQSLARIRDLRGRRARLRGAPAGVAPHLVRRAALRRTRAKRPAHAAEDRSWKLKSGQDTRTRRRCAYTHGSILRSRASRGGRAHESESAASPSRGSLAAGSARRRPARSASDFVGSVHRVPGGATRVRPKSARRSHGQHTCAARQHDA